MHTFCVLAGYVPAGNGPQSLQDGFRRILPALTSDFCARSMASMVERATGQRRAARVPVHDFDAPVLPPWSDLASLTAELAWLHSWTRRLEEENERLRRTVPVSPVPIAKRGTVA